MLDSGGAISSSDLPSALTPRHQLDDGRDQHQRGAEQIADQDVAAVAAADQHAEQPRPPTPPSSVPKA